MECRVDCHGWVDCGQNPGPGVAALRQMTGQSEAENIAGSSADAAISTRYFSLESDAIVLRRDTTIGDAGSCILSLAVDSDNHLNVRRVYLVLSVRNIELYSGDEYLYTSQGTRVESDESESDGSEMSLYQHDCTLEVAGDGISMKDLRLKLVGVSGSAEELVVITTFTVKVLEQASPTPMAKSTQPSSHDSGTHPEQLLSSMMAQLYPTSGMPASSFMPSATPVNVANSTERTLTKDEVLGIVHEVVDRKLQPIESRLERLESMLMQFLLSQQMKEVPHTGIDAGAGTSTTH